MLLAPVPISKYAPLEKIEVELVFVISPVTVKLPVILALPVRLPSHSPVTPVKLLPSPWKALACKSVSTTTLAPLTPEFSENLKLLPWP